MKRNLAIAEKKKEEVYLCMRKPVELEVEIAANAHMHLVFTVLTAGDISVNTYLHGEGAVADVVGIVPGLAGAELRIKTMQVHQARSSTSNLLVKSLVFGGQSFSYSGFIRVEKEAQKIDAYQRNENLLLGENSQARSAPGLEILANDVRCTHGATVGQIDEEQLWYLGTRGIARNDAKRMIATGFLERALSGASDTIVERARRDIWHSLSKQHV